jgi:hypothetical protein
VKGAEAGARLRLAGALTLAALIAVATASVPATAAEPSARSDEKGLVMCQGNEATKYALCDAALCTPIPEQQKYPGPPETKPSHALCECVVEPPGPNLGPGPCSDRVPRGAKGEYILSTYSYALKKPYLTCNPPHGPRTVCFGYPCRIDEHNPKLAHCTCPIIYDDTDVFMTQGGGCNVAACTHGLWQGGTPGDYTVINDIFSKATGEKPPANCAAIVKKK